jgi:type IV secretory pathway VirB4 component
MEFLIVLGGALSLPIIHYCNQPVPPQEKKEEEPQVKPQQRQLSESEILELKKRAQQRKDRILKELTPNEQELLQEYLDNLKNPKKDPQSLKFLVASVVFVFVFLIVIALAILTDQGSKSSKDL